ncbi:MAG: bifunctional 5,10-methylenetetrahydrofolate dehydrogenase/5,10-methenyltetrahydrofolate cyclohydrolase [Planctomycetota bacterium]|nr:bifunctional 5,10-methylenetetrahydrofolate dehydrogenase/5,10-methenyltetrahydrofolate cyclohydrolase [Planctomycetota bacterium]
MPAKIIDGVALAERTKQDVAARVQALPRAVHLVAILVGATPSGELYAQRQGDACRSLGIEYDLVSLPDDVTQKDVKREIRRLNDDAGVTGIMMHLPLPAHLDAPRLQYEIDVVKDVEGVNPANIGYVVYGHTVIAPCTALSVIELIKSTGVEIKGSEATVVGASQIVGKPVSLLLTEQMATVSLCHIETRDIREHPRRAEILVVAAGKAGLITADHVREGAVVVDVGINRIVQPDGTKKTVGDVDFEAVRQKVGHITPVPGGVGPMTVAMLLKNTLRSAEIHFGLNRG